MFIPTLSAGRPAALTTIIDSNKRYRIYRYSDEKELDDHFATHVKEVFGDRVVYLPGKFLMKGDAKRPGSIPDGYMIDLQDPTSPSLYIVEVERSEHDLLSHMATQVLGFELNFRENKQRIYERLLEQINGDAETRRLSESALRDTAYRSAEALVHDLIFKKDHTVLIVIDHKDQSLADLTKLLSVPIRIMEFKTYVTDVKKGLNSDHVHRYEPLYEEEGHVSEGEETPDTVYKATFEVFEEPNTPRGDFEKLHTLTTRIQGFNYLYAADGSITGIVFAGYKSRIDEHLNRLRQGQRYPCWWRTRRPIDPTGWKTDMDVFILDAYYDADVGRFVESPLVRVHGRLRSLERVQAGKATQVFPQAQ